MSLPPIGALNLGKIDAKHEISFSNWNDRVFFDSFLIPDNVNLDEFDKRLIYFVRGFRGTGKTTLLRYYVAKAQPDTDLCNIILFKSDIDEEQRIAISKQSGFSIADIDSSRMGIAQDFRSAWRWFICHKVGEMIAKNPRIVQHDTNVEALLRILGLRSKPFHKLMGYLPRIEGANVKLVADLEFFGAELGLVIKRGESAISVSMRDLSLSALNRLTKIQFASKVMIAVDELEAFFDYSDKFTRDVAMIRDLILVADELNETFKNVGCPIYLIVAIRSEIISAIGPTGHEIERLIHDRGVTLSWHTKRRSLDHPILMIVKKKIAASLNVEVNDSLLTAYFQNPIYNIPLEVFLLDQSFYRPRDIMWRLRA